MEDRGRREEERGERDSHPETDGNRRGEAERDAGSDRGARDIWEQRETC